MESGTALRRLAAVCGVVAVLLVGCNRSEDTVTGTLPRVDGTEFQRDEVADSCLEGSWTMRTADLDILIATLVPIPNLRVPEGSLYIDFSEGAYNYGADSFVIRIDLGSPSKYLQGTAAFLTTGGYDTEDGKLILINSSTRKEVMEWKAVKDDRVEVAPGGGPAVSLIPNGPVPYTCSSEELVLYLAGPSGSVPMIFKRWSL